MFREYELTARTQGRHDTNDLVEEAEDVAAKIPIVGEGTNGASWPPYASPYGPPPKKPWWVP